MTYEQVIKPNLNQIGYVGMCLAYAGRAFGITSGPATAWLAWQQIPSVHKHANQKFPKNVSFPVWFSGYGGDGHVAVYTPKGIYSSPWQAGTTHAVLSSISQLEKTYGVKYVGWSTWIEGKQVIKESEEDMLTARQQQNLYREYLGRTPGTKAQARVGKVTYDQEYQTIISGAEYKGLPAEVKAGKHNLNDHLPSKLRNLK